jgi:hypothetical protein
MRHYVVRHLGIRQLSASLFSSNIFANSVNCSNVLSECLSGRIFGVDGSDNVFLRSKHIYLGLLS